MTISDKTKTYGLPAVLCWVCEKPIKQDVFGPFVITSSGRASACSKCSTHKFILNNEGMLTEQSVHNND